MTAYEPGSVFKIFTVASMYDAGLIKASDSFLCDGVFENRIRGGETIRIKCLEHHGWITPREALKYSCNDALAQIASRTTDENFMEMVRKLGFGQRTGIELPSETSGSVKDVNSRLWSARSKPTIAMGQEISVSALQMIQAASAIANGGIPVKPAVVKRITNRDGSIYYEHKPELKERIFREGTASYLLSCMETTATSGTGSRAHLNDISIGVKTGTAQMADKITGYTHLQRAQPILFSHHMMAYFSMLKRDFDRFRGVYERCDIMPLGAGALAGTTFPIDRPFVAEQLNFDAIYSNSLDAVSDRDYIMEFLSAASILMVHLSRLSETFNSLSMGTSR